MFEKAFLQTFYLNFFHKKFLVKNSVILVEIAYQL